MKCHDSHRRTPLAQLATRHPLPTTPRRQAGMALVVTLAVVVLVTIAAMAFFSRATSNRTIEHSRANQVLASQLAETAQDYVIAQFLKEMTTNAQAFTNNGVTVYQVTNPAGMVPQRLLAQSSMTNDTNFANLVRQSAPSADPNASPDSTATASQNGRVVTAGRWNAPILNFGSGFTADDQLPNWIYVNRDGTVANAASSNAIGRFAYNVYDTGGLLDANVAGYPSAVTGTNLQAIKSTLAGADLAALGLAQTAIDALVAFRNPQATSASAYANYVAGATKTGFLKNIVTNASGTGVTTNNFFASRQDLIRYAKTQNAPLTNALPLLAHASRASTAPSWGPTNPASSTIDYATLANTNTGTNRLFPNARVKGGFTRRDGTEAEPGEALVNSRFALDKLAWLGADGPVAPGTAATIQRDFGLAWDSANKRWNYVGHTGNTVQSAIKTLDQVASDNREPNFFELLKAGILAGSLGGGSFDGGFGTVGSPLYARTKDAAAQANWRNTARIGRLADYHVWQLGANIIDQADADSFPTRITFEAGEFQNSANPALEAERGISANLASVHGQEALPYFSKIIPSSYRPQANTAMVPGAQPTYRAFTRHWMRFELWNPYADAAGPSAPQVRIKYINPTGNTGRSLRMRLSSYDNNNWWISSPGAGSASNPAPTLTLTPAASAGFGSPKVVAPADADAGTTTPQNILSEAGGGQFAGLWLGDMNAPDTRIAGTPPPADLNLDGVIDGTESLNAALTSAQNHGPIVTGGSFPGNINDSYADFDLQVNVNGAWLTYQTVRNFEHASQTHWYWSVGDLTNPAINETQTVMMAFTAPDPRTQRFEIRRWHDVNAAGTGHVWSRTGADYSADLFGRFPVNTRGRLMRNSTDGTSMPSFKNGNSSAAVAGASGWDATDNNRPVADYTENASASGVSYTDVDGIRRPGDSIGTGHRPFGGPANTKPVILNRPLRSAAEIAFAFRDLPWKSLDFFSADSGDAALLDLFSATDEPAAAAGKVSLNSAPAPVLASLLRGTDRWLGGAASLPVSDADAIAIAEEIRSYLADPARKAVNPADLATGFLASLDAADSTKYPAVKHQREAVVRALAGSTETRMWNLLADIIVQSGRFPGASVAAGNFAVESEARTWLQMSLDRFLARPAARSAEAVGE